MDSLMLFVKKVQRAGEWFLHLPLTSKLFALLGLVVALWVGIF